QPPAAGAGRRLPLQVVLRAEAHFRVRSTPAEPGSSSGLSPPLRRTVHLLQLPPVSLSPFSCLRVALRPYEVHPRLPRSYAFLRSPLNWYVLPEIPVRHAETRLTAFGEVAVAARRIVEIVFMLHTHGARVSDFLQHRKERRPVNRAQSRQPEPPPIGPIHWMNAAVAQDGPADLRVFQMHVVDLVHEIARRLDRVHHLPDQV